MIPLPTPPVRGQRIQADLLRDLIAAVRRCRPIQGQGILLQETLQGTVIALAGRQKTAADTPFDHRFKVTCRAEGEADAPTYALLIRKGSLFEIQDGKATEEELTLEGLTQAPDDSDAWRVANVSAGSLYIRKETAEGKEGYTLAYGEPTDALFVIADFTPSASSAEPFPKVTQRILGDLYLGNAAESGPLPWLVREGPADDVTGMAEWQIYSPLWIDDGKSYTITDAPVQDSPGWYTLPISPSDGTALYAILTDGVLTADVSDYRAAKSVLIGKFVQITVDGVPTLSFTQIHTGTIFTSSGGLPVGTQLAGEIYHDASARSLKQHIMCWNGTVWLTDLDLDGKAIGPRTVFVYDLTQVSDTTLETGDETLNQRRRTIRNIMSISPTQTAETVTTVFGTTPLPSNIASYQTDVSEE